jgi:hypothetical protein
VPVDFGEGASAAAEDQIILQLPVLEKVCRQNYEASMIAYPLLFDEFVKDEELCSELTSAGFYAVESLF